MRIVFSYLTLLLLSACTPTVEDLMMNDDKRNEVLIGCVIKYEEALVDEACMRAVQAQIRLMQEGKNFNRPTYADDT